MVDGGDSVDSKLKHIIPGMSPLTLGSESVETPLCKEHGQEFKYFCKSHMAELCLTCKRMEHKNCKTVVDIEEAAAEIYSECHGDKIVQSVKQLSDRFGEYKTTAQASKSKLPGKKQIAIDSVKQTRKCVDAYLDKLEADALIEIDTIFVKETKTLDEQIHVCNASISFLSTSLSSLNRMMSVGNKEEKFVEINRATKQIKQYCSMLLDLSHEMYDIDVKFEKNEKITNLKDMLKSIGKCSVISSPYTCVTTTIAPIYMGEIKIKKKTGNRRAIASFDVLPDGRKLLLDVNNKELQLYDQNNIFLTEVALPSHKFYRIVSLSNTEAVVSTYSDKLLKVTINDGLAVTETKTNHIIGPMCNYGQDIIASLYRVDGFQISVTDKDFNIKRTIIKDDGTLFKFPWFLAASTDQSMLFVTDLDKGCFGLKMDGQILFHYQDPEADTYCGLAVGSDCLFLGVKHHQKTTPVQKLNLSGVREACANFSESYPLKIVDNELVLITIYVPEDNLFINFQFI